jgi:hypothetical protein
MRVPRVILFVVLLATAGHASGRRPPRWAGRTPEMGTPVTWGGRATGDGPATGRVVCQGDLPRRAADGGDRARVTGGEQSRLGGGAGQEQGPLKGPK